jgi:hypothetical protein
MRIQFRITSLLLVLVLASCSGRGGSRIKPPALSPAAAAEQAMATYDTNKDGFLDAKELEKCPALLAALDDLDKNKDKKLSASEIEAELADMRDSRAGIVSITCVVEMDGRPLMDATVRFVPEAFLGSSYKPAQGVSLEDGSVPLRTEGYDVDGVPPGFFRIEVSKKDASGQEAVPARYNSATTLGAMISTEMRTGVRLRLTSR